MILNNFFLLAFSLIIYLISIKGKILVDGVNQSSHKTFIKNKKNVPLIGGIIIFFSTILFLELDFIKLTSLMLILTLGIFSDLNIIFNANKRFLLQLLIIIFFFQFSEIKIEDTRIDLFDNLLLNPLFSLFFCSFCLMILINGFNFIDGINGLSLGYFAIVSSNIIYLSYIIPDTSFFLNDLNFVIIQLLIFGFILSGFFFLGDAGSYLIGFILGVQIISINFYLPFISPYYLILLIWYPCFEVLFSFIRKIKTNKSPLKPDNNHLHQLLYSKLKKKINSLHVNSSASIIILIYNLIMVLFSNKFIFNTTVCILLLCLNVIIYLISYYFLNKEYEK